MAVGTIKWFNDAKGVGSIRAETGAEVSVHFSAIQGDRLRPLAEGDEVEFEIRETEVGLQAANVVRH
jgi:CspA family cold shock protein